MKTIAITSFHTLISRNILATPVLEALRREKDLRVVLVVPDYKVDFFKARFGLPALGGAIGDQGGDNVFIYGAEQYRGSRTFLGLLFKRLGMLVYNTPTTRMKKAYKYYWDKKLFHYVFGILMGLIGRSFMVRRLIRWLDLNLSPRDLFKPLFDEYKPDLIFSTDVQNENDVSLAQDAIRRWVPVIGMIRSWDNPTQRILRFFPAKLLVGSQALYDEVWKYYRYPREKTIIVGNPHYDKYLKPRICSRGEFFKKWGLDPAKKLVLYTASGHILIKVNDYDQYVMETLGKFSGQVLARFPLSGDVRLVDFKQPANMVIDKPGEKFGNKELELREEDDISLIEQLTYADVVVTGPTSICLDAALLDRPIVAVDFYPTARPWYKKNFGFLATHIENLLNTNGVRYVKSPVEMFEAINAYLADPALHSEGRAKIRQKWFSHIDGRASERLAGELVKLL